MNEKMNNSKDEKEFLLNSISYAKSAGINVNPKVETAQGIIKGLFKNKQTKGEFYCPCRVTSGDKEKDKDLICPCVFHRGEIELEGKCRCFLFVK